LTEISWFRYEISLHWKKTSCFW